MPSTTRSMLEAYFSTHRVTVDTCGLPFFQQPRMSETQPKSLADRVSLGQWALSNEGVWHGGRRSVPLGTIAASASGVGGVSGAPRHSEGLRPRTARH
jgi:hypothetical protein